MRPEEYMLFVVITSIISIILESFFICFLFRRTKNIENSQVYFFIGIIISFILSSILISFNYYLQIYLYIIFAVFIFLTAKILYKEKIHLLDFLVIGYIILLATSISIPFALLYKNGLISYTIFFLITRIFMIFIMFFIGRLNLNKYYNLFLELWDRRDDGRIKAITVRNVSLVIFNIGLYIIYIFLSKIILE